MGTPIGGSMSRRRFHATMLGGAAVLAAGGRPRRAAAAGKLTSVAAMVAEAEVSWEKEMARKWNQAHPEAPWEPEDVGWEAIFEKILAYEKAGTPADLGYGWTGFTADWHRMGIIDAPEDYLGKSWKDRFSEHIVTRGGDVIGGKLWCVPIQDASYGLVSRRDWLKEAGVDPYAIRNWDQLADAMGKVARVKRNKPFGVPLGNARNAGEKTEWMFRGNGLNNLADFDPAKRANYIEVLETLLRLRPYISDDAFSQDYTGHRQAFATGVAGFISIGDYYFGEVYPTAKALMKRESVVIIPYPGGSKGPGPFTSFDLNSYFLMKSGKNKEKTVQLVEFLTRRENVLRWSLGHPPVKGWTVDEAVKNRLYGEAERWWLEDVLTLASKVPVLAAVGMVAKNEVQQVYYEHLLKVFDKKMTPTEAYDSMRPKITALTKAAGG
jgi:ABC-type glycerol-3-phosphate transport system substrate-binding protein